MNLSIMRTFLTAGIVLMLMFILLELSEINDKMTDIRPVSQCVHHNQFTVSAEAGSNIILPE